MKLTFKQRCFPSIQVPPDVLYFNCVVSGPSAALKISQITFGCRESSYRVIFWQITKHPLVLVCVKCDFGSFQCRPSIISLALYPVVSAGSYLEHRVKDRTGLYTQSIIGPFYYHVGPNLRAKCIKWSWFLGLTLLKMSLKIKRDFPHWVWHTLLINVCLSGLSDSHHTRSGNTMTYSTKTRCFTLASLDIDRQLE